MVEPVTRGILTAPTGEQTRAAAARALQAEGGAARAEREQAATNLSWAVAILAAGLVALAFFALLELGRMPADPSPGEMAPPAHEQQNQTPSTKP